MELDNDFEGVLELVVLGLEDIEGVLVGVGVLDEVGEDDGDDDDDLDIDGD
jgi:hypothetical protein